MIKFFRKIRKQLLSGGENGKPALPSGRYLKYAIGEIVLVVIGILIALSINNWNIDRFEKIKSKEYHERLIEELDLKIQTFNGDSIRSLNIAKYLVATINTLQKSSLSKADIDTLEYTFKNYYKFHQISDKLKSYEEMKSSGDLGLIYNTELRKSINYYTEKLEAVSKIYLGMSRHISDTKFLDKYIFNKVNINTNDSGLKYNLSDLRKDEHLVNTLSRFTQLYNLKKHQSHIAMTRTIELKVEIQKELQKY